MTDAAHFELRSDDTLLVTGGAGFIGSNFVRYALEHCPARVAVLDKLTYAGSLESLTDVSDSPRFVFLQGDIAVAEDVEVAFDRFRPVAVLNFAAESHVDRSIDGPEAFVRTNVLGTFVLLDAARRRLAVLAGDGDPRRFRFLHVSTDEVFGSLGLTGAFTETTPYAPNSPYSASKAGADHLVRAYHHTYGLPTLLTNCSNNYGPYQFPEKLIPVMILNALAGRDLPIYGDGANVRDWLHVDDHCSALLRILERGRPGGSYNVGGGNERTNLEVVEAICAVLERERPASASPALRQRGASSYLDLRRFVTDRPGHDQRYAIDASRLESELGWRAKYDFESGLEQTVRWYLDHLDWCESVGGGAERERRGTSTGASPVPVEEGS